MSYQKIIDKIKEQIQQHIYLGASLALYDGKWQEFYLGEATSHHKTKAGLVYDLASVSKVVGVGTLIIFLVQEGKLNLDARFQSYYPDFQDPSVTVRQLLTHTSGIDPFIPNRNHLNDSELKRAIHQVTVKADKSFHYTDINFILLGFLLEKIYGQSLNHILQEHVFDLFGMVKTSFGPVRNAVPTAKNIPIGTVHDPKAQILGVHTGSAGLFSTLKDLEVFTSHYLKDDFAAVLTQDYAFSDKKRSLAWDLQGDWLLHTGYTGTFVLINIQEQRAAVFLSNRTYEKDERAQWILDRDELIGVIKQALLESYSSKISSN
ncbi:serine hydrolase domain-containing protein [Streptococcus macacae]|uniref:Beta-lactamase n=1 Tax=Streptococcus macacae NCTC 11558 TaxID=764298 RepID=G5JXX4_9STRE|nr:serine hydrolase domain-containing protein [Streptococcus macacae]EHJ52071.1 beta-lactamase [Streptococcus macacae NCTC 11558]SUN77893.1 secreted esterase [Streptococcus macacae NCTC 11558]